MWNVLLTAIVVSIPLARAHVAAWHDSMWGYSVRDHTFPYDNRPETPHRLKTFKQWWFHEHLDYPPPEGRFFELPAGGPAVAQLACNMGATDFWRDSPGTTDIRTPDDDSPCPNSGTTAYHSYEDLRGCGLAIAYTSDVHSIQPEDLAIFSVNHTCVWKAHTIFQVPKDMPACPPGGCICSFHWIHSKNGGAAEMFMNGFRCKVTGSTSDAPIMKPEVPKRCTNDPSKCYSGAQQPMYWWQQERNNMFNDEYDPPYYGDEYGFFDGPQNGIFGKRDGSTPLPSTSTHEPSSTLAGDKPPSTPTSSKPSSTPASSKPASKPSSSPSPPKESTCKHKHNKKRQHHH